MMQQNLARGAMHLSHALMAGLIIYLMIFAVCKTAGKTEGMKNGKWIQQYLFLVYLIFIGIVTGIFSIQSWDLHGAHNYNLIPFSEESLTYVLLNILLFIPMGFFLPVNLNNRKRKIWFIILIVFAVSLGIEFLQFSVAGRLADIDDVLANTFGSAVGYGIYRIGSAFGKRYSKKRHVGVGTYSIIISIIGMFFGYTFPPLICYGDMILAQFGIPIWSGNQNGILSMDGIHYSLFLYLGIEILAAVIAKKYSEDLGSKAGMIFSWIGILYFGAALCMNLSAFFWK